MLMKKNCRPQSLQPSSQQDYDFQTHMLNNVQPLWDSTPFKTFKGTAGILITWKAFPAKNPKAKIILLHGAGESSMNYLQTVFDLVTSRYSVYTMDFRGHGSSQRMTQNSKLIHLDQFQHLSNDLGIFTNLVEQFKNTSLPIFILANGMGALVSCAHFQKPQKANIRGAIFISPVPLTIPRSFLHELLFSTHLRILNRLGYGENFAPGQDITDTDQLTESETHLKNSNKFFQNRISLDSLNTPQKIGYSVQFLIQWAHAIRTIIRKPWHHKTPVLIIVGKTNKRALQKNRQLVNKFEKCQFVSLAESKLECINDPKNPIRIQVMSQIFDYLQEWSELRHRAEDKQPP